jgi:hypothetical protein
MRRWLLIFLVVLLPMQLSWAAVASYCLHETGPAAQHLGHHEHQHKADAERTDSGNPKAVGAIDADCGICHAGCAAVVFEPAALLQVAVSLDTGSARPVRISSPPPSLPERPNWADLA